MDGAKPLGVEVGCPDYVKDAIYGPSSPDKERALEESMRRWWRVYSERKMRDPGEEYTANSMVYDPDRLPNSPRAPPDTPTAAEQ